jgi:hypothetical protein
VKPGPRPKPLEGRFWPKVDTTGDCWIWTGVRDGYGYGRIWRGDFVLDGGTTKEVRAHRVAWSLVNGAVPAGLDVCHRCDNPPCCNPAHLFLGTRSENMLDAGVKSRFAHSTPQWKRAKALELHDLGLPQREIARALGTTQGSVWNWLTAAGRTGPRRRKLDQQRADEIRRLREDGVRPGVLARQFDVAPATISDVLARRIWA